MPSRDLAGVRVLVVDDDEDARELLVMLCTSRGAQAWQADTVAAALRLVASERPHVVLSDLGMPGSEGEDGYTLLRAMRTLPDGAGRDLIVVALTGRARSEDREATSVAGFDAHVVKPLGIDDLAQVIASLVAKSGALQKG